MAVVVSPVYPVKGSAVTLSMTATAGTVFGFEIISVPSTSTVATGLLLQGFDTTAVLPVSPTIAAGIESSPGVSALYDSFTPDVAGEYVVTGYDMRQVLGFPSFPGDPSGETRVELIGSQTTTINVGELVELEVHTNRGDGGKVQIQINEDTVRAAAMTTFLTDRSRAAALEATVVAALAALVGASVATVGTDLQTGVNDLRAKYEAHRTNTGATFHVDSGGVASPDSVNIVEETDADSQEGAIELLNIISENIGRHERISSSSNPAWHIDDDLKNLLLSKAAVNLATATVMSAELRERVYERHRLQSSVMPAPFDNPNCHIRQDDINALSPPSLLDDVIVAFLDVLAEPDPTAAPGESEGVIDAAHMYGFSGV